MNRRFIRILLGCFFGGLPAVSFLSCTDWVYDNRDGCVECSEGIRIGFRYDYNLQEADMFSDLVDKVTVYIFDAEGRYMAQFSDENSGTSIPLAQRDYSMNIEGLPAGSYRFVALAGENPDATAPGVAEFVRSEPGSGGTWEDLSLALPTAGEPATVGGDGKPLEVLYHAMSTEPVVLAEGSSTRTELSLTRDTKYIGITLCETDGEKPIDVADYEFRITDRNSGLHYDNSVVEDKSVTYLPYAVWNTDGSPDDVNPSGGRMAHADFTTSRIIAHRSVSDDARLIVTRRDDPTTPVIDISLPGYLGQLRSHAELSRYDLQEFLDRANDFRLTFFLHGGSWQYVNISIDVLGWDMRVDNIGL